MEPIRVIHPPEVPWGAYTIALILLIAGPLLFHGWIRNWPRVAPGEPAVEPNSWIAAKSDSRMQAAAAFKPIMDVQIVSDAQPRDSLINMPVQLTTAGVTGVPDANGFWVTQVRTPSIFVAFGPNTKKAPVEFDDAVDLTGRVRRIPDLNTIHALWPGLRGRDLKRLERQAVYVEASEISITGQY